MEITALKNTVPSEVSVETDNKVTKFTAPGNRTSIPDLMAKDHEVEWRQIQEEEEEHLEKYLQKEHAKTLGSLDASAPPPPGSESTELQEKLQSCEQVPLTSAGLGDSSKQQHAFQQPMLSTPEQQSQPRTTSLVFEQQTPSATDEQLTPSETANSSGQSPCTEPAHLSTLQPQTQMEDSSEHISELSLLALGSSAHAAGQASRAAGPHSQQPAPLDTQLQTPVATATTPSENTSSQPANTSPESEVVPLRTDATTEPIETRHESQEGTSNTQQVDDDEETDDAPHQPVERSEVISQAVDTVPPPISMSPLAPPTITPKSQQAGNQRPSATMNPVQHQLRLAPISTHRLSYSPTGVDPFGSLLPTANENEEEELKNLELTLQIVMSENKRLEDIVNRLRSRLVRARLTYPQGFSQAPNDRYGPSNSNPYLSHQKKQNPRSHPSVTEQARLLERGKLTTKNTPRPLPGSIKAIEEARKRYKLTGSLDPETAQWLHNNQPQGKKYRHRPSPNLVNEVQKEVKKKQASSGKNKASSNVKKTKPVKKATRRSSGSKLSTKKKGTKAKKDGKSTHELKGKASTKSTAGKSKKDTKRAGKPNGRSKVNKNKALTSPTGKKASGHLDNRAEEDISLAELVRRRSSASPLKNTSSAKQRKKSTSVSLRKKSASASPRKKSASASPRKKSASASPRKKSASASPRKKSTAASPQRKSASTSPRRRSVVGKPGPASSELEAGVTQTKASKMVKELARKVIEAKKKEAERMKMHQME